MVPRAAVRVGQPQRDQHQHLLGEQSGQPGRRQPAHPPGHAGVEAQRRPQPDPGPPGRDEQRQAQDDHPGRRPEGEQQLGVAVRQPGRRARSGRPVGDRREQQVDADDHQAGHQRRQRRPDEPPVRLQDAGQHDPDAVQHDLRREGRPASGRRCPPGRGTGRRPAWPARSARTARPPAGRPGSAGRRPSTASPTPCGRRRPGPRPPGTSESTGTTLAASAPPATTSNSTFGTRFALA